MADRISLEEAQAKMWIADVKAEIEIVEGILKNVTKVMTEVPGEDDSIYQSIKKIAGTVTTVWTDMISKFMQASEQIETTIKTTVAAGEAILQEGESLNRKMGK